MKFILLCIICVLDCVISKRISELKCEHPESLSTDSTSYYPHLMVILEKNSDESIELICVATLISGDYILTSATCLSWVSKIDNILISKLKLPGEPYPDDNIEYFPVKRLLAHELYNNKTSSAHNVGLIQLEQPILFTSFIRPACLWTNAFPDSDKFETYGTVQHYGTRYTNFTTIPLTTLSNDACTKEFKKTSKALANCLDLLNSFVCYDKNFGSTGFFGSPIEVKVNNQNYIYGIILGCSSNCWSIKISHSIDWIESTVWPNQIKHETPINSECGQRKVKHKSLMTYSLPTYLGEFPWHVGIFKNNRQYICGGTIISNRAVLTAAYCVQDERGVIPPNRFSIVAGTNILNEYPIEAQNYIIERIIVHPNFNSLYAENDIAILRYTIQFSNYVQPICLNNSLEYTSNMLGLVTGWVLNDVHFEPNLLLQGTFLIHDNFYCRASNREFFNNFLNDNNYCAGHENGTSVCSSHLGGGMIFEHKSRWYLRGIVSRAALPNSKRCNITQLVLFTDVPKLYNWIISNVKDDV